MDTYKPKKLWNISLKMKFLDLLYWQMGEVGENIYTDNNEKSK